MSTKTTERPEKDRTDEVRQFFHDLCASVMCEPVSLDAEDFRAAVVNLGLGYSKGMARKFCNKVGQGGELVEADLIEFLNPWIEISPHQQTITCIFKKALLSDVYGGSPSPAKKIKKKPLPNRKLPKNPSLRRDPTQQDIETLQPFFEEISDLYDEEFIFPDFRDDLLPANVSLTHLEEFTVPFTFDCFIKLFLLQECFYSSVQHSLENGLHDPILTLWHVDEPWFRRGFTCVADVVEVPAFLSGKLAKTTPVKVITRLKQLQPGAFVYHFRTETPNAPCGNLFYSHEVWKIRQLSGKCKIDYSVGLQWRQSTWLQRPIVSFVNRGSLKATKLYFDAIVAKFNESKGIPAISRLEGSTKKDSQTLLSKCVWMFFILFVGLEFSFPHLSVFWKLSLNLFTFFAILSTNGYDFK